MSEDLWYYEKDGQQHGPVSQAELQALIESGAISRENLAWKPGEKDWTETGTFEVLLPAFKTPPPMRQQELPPPPPPPPPLEPTPPVISTDDLGRDSESPTSTSPSKNNETAQKKDSKQEGTKKPPSKRISSALALLWSLAKKVREWHADKPLRVVSSVSMTITTLYIAWCTVPPSQPKPKPAPDPTSLHGTRVPVGYTGPVGQIKIDANPWAQLTDLTDESGRSLTVPGLQATPLVLLVPPGRYQIRLRGQDAQGIEGTCDVEVLEEQVTVCSRTVQSVDAAAYYRQVGW